MSDTITGAPSLDGWVLVPREPTPEMEQAFDAAYWAKAGDASSPTPTEYPYDGGGAFGYGYRAMCKEASRGTAVGLVVVPRDPTQDQLVAGNDMFHDGEVPLNIYRAMVEAAPPSEFLAQALAAAWEEGRVAGLNEAADWLKPTWALPCDCERCDCGNPGDTAAVAAWHAENDASEGIRALITPPTPAQTDTALGGRADG